MYDKGGYEVLINIINVSTSHLCSYVCCDCVGL